MRIAYIDAYAGVSGDMLLGALVDLGLPLEELEHVVKTLGLAGEASISKEKVLRRGIAGTKVLIDTKDHHEHRHLHHIVEAIKEADLPTISKERAIAVFRRLAEAEASVHGVSVEEIHFHEVGAADAMVDIVGVCHGMYVLGIDRIIHSPIRVGGGYVDCAHGRLPVPAPATAMLLKGLDVFGGDVEGEWATPTGVSLISTLGHGSRWMPAMKITKVGVGAGDKDPASFGNLLRIFLGDINGEEEIYQRDRVSIIEATIDDMSGEYYPYIMEKLLKLPVRDVYFTPVIMKKGRPGQNITVLVENKDINKVLDILLRESTTYGLRIHEAERVVLERTTINIPWRNRRIRVKVGFLEEQPVQVSPEYEDCKEAALENELELKSVYHEVLTLAKNILAKEGCPGGKVE